ncbi:WecB/TagA/CpsF family glycosyltransferase [Pseudarthrobacter sp. P1]|uniref:WecB/TagA/CpsF family glycosyltransferase n=1 Tax=Pseudarthrobacter sp. P1 TaxID=3418418 RepID=UPI003CF3799C
MANRERFSIRHRIGSINFISASPRDAAGGLIELALDPNVTSAHVHLANAYTIALADMDEGYRNALSDQALNFPDGKPLGWASRIKGHKTPLIQVRGPQLFLDVMELGLERNVRHFLLGSTPQVLSLLETNLKKMFPDIEIVGTISPPFRKLSENELEIQDREIRESGAHIVWVGLGTPKQDFEVLRLAGTVAAVSVAIGAAFDFSAGTLPQAPAWMRAVGLEWFFRLIKEPRRLWRRYLIGNLQFIRSTFFRKGSKE